MEKRKNYDAERKQYIIGKRFKVIEIGERCWWKQVKRKQGNWGDIEEKLPMSQTSVRTATQATDQK